MKRTIIYSSLIMSLLFYFQDNRAQDVIADTAGIIIGAIRWDWTGGGTVTEAVEKALGPKHWHYRVPFFGEILNDSTIRASCATQQCVDQEILYAKENGLDYWAFLLYDEGSDLDLPFRRYHTSGYKPLLKYSVIAKEGQAAVDRVVNYFKDPEYQTVLSGRPLLYIFRESSLEYRNAIRNACADQGIADPYMVSMLDTPPADVDAITLYWYGGSTYGGETYGAPYSTLAASARGFWNRNKDAGYTQVPLVSAGTDGRPRIENPPPWVPDPSFYEKYFEAPAPAELAGSVQEAVNFVAANPVNCESRAILIYAWNENDEGGWLTPTLDTTHPSLIDDSHLKAIKEVVWPTDPSDPHSKDASLHAILVNGDTLPGFHPDTLAYRVYLDAGAGSLPVITAISSEKYAEVKVLPPDLIEEIVHIEVTSDDGSVQRAYSIKLQINYEPADTIGWEFNTPFDTEGWSSQWIGHANITVQDSTLLVNVTDTYPEIKSSTGLNIKAATYNKLILSMKNNTSSNDFYLRYYFPDGELVTKRFTPSTMDTVFHEYVFDMSADPQWQGTIDQIRWLVARFTGTGTVEIDYVRLGITDEPLSDEALLSGLWVDGEPLEGFSPETEIYADTLPAGTSLAPVVTATATHPGATVNIVQASQPDDVSTIQVISQSGLFSKIYTIDFEVLEIPRTPWFYTGFTEGTLPVGWKASVPGYSATVQDQVFRLNISKSGSEDHYTLGNLFVEDFDLRSYMTIRYRSGDTLQAGVRILGPLGSVSPQEVFELPASELWTSLTLNLSALASETWGYDLDSIQLVFQPGESGYSGTFEMDEIMVGDSVQGKTFQLSLYQAPPFIVNLGSDTTIVAPATLELDAGNPGKIYLWSTGETTQTIQVDTAGTYWVRVIGEHNCTHSDTIRVTLDIEEDVREANIESGPRLYPNPNRGMFRLDLRNSEEIKRAELMLLSSSGKICYYKLVENLPPGSSVEINLKDPSAGLYLFRAVFDGRPVLKNVAMY